MRALLFFLLTTPAVAYAQQGPVAEQLYRDGQKLIAAGKTHEACLKFADSERADPALGTLIALAACHEREGKVGSAWSEFGEAADVAERQHDALRARFARTHAAALEGKVHRIRIEVSPRVAGMSLQLADKTYGEGTLGSAIPLDPGDYALEVRAPGKKPWSGKVHVEASGGEEKIAVTLDDAPPEPAPTVPPPSPAAPSALAPPVAPPSSTRVAGLIVLGVGGALGVTALILQASAASQSTRAIDDAAVANTLRDPRQYDNARSEHDDAIVTQRFALLAGGVGLAAIAVGGYLAFLAPAVRVTPVATRGGGGAALGGVF